MSAAQDLAKKIEHAFNNEDVDAFLDCFTDDAIQIHSMDPNPHEGKAAIRGFEGAMFAGFSDIDFTVKRVIEQGDWVAVESHVSATNTGPLQLPTGELAPTGRSVALDQVSIARLSADGRIAEEHRYSDGAAFAAQLGLMG